MKKNNSKSTEENKPVVTEIPLPKSESALVIDLPDGQKLVVGKMENGTVIEVATWRGTGRPDSRTNRLMLGMSNTTLQESEKKVDSNSSSDSVPSDWKGRLKNRISALNLLIMKNLNISKNFLTRTYSKTKVKLFRKKNKDNFSKELNRGVEARIPELDFDVQEWLEKISHRATDKRIQKRAKVPAKPEFKGAKKKRN